MIVNEKLYDSNFFSRYFNDKKYLNDHKVLAKAVKKIFSPSYVIDIGCGSGQILYHLKNKFQIEVKGFEGSKCASVFWMDEVKDSIEIADCSVNLPDPSKKADVVICLEVAEHIPTEGSDALVENITKYSSNHVVFSAAPPGQGGKNKSHINEQPWKFWKTKFKAHNFSLNEKLNNAFHVLINQRIMCPWYINNTRILSHDI